MIYREDSELDGSRQALLTSYARPRRDLEQCYSDWLNSCAYAYFTSVHTCSFFCLCLSPKCERLGTILLFLEQIITPSRAARTCCEEFCRCSPGEIASELPEIFYAFGPQLNTFMSVGICLRIWPKTARIWVKWNLGMSRFLSLTKLCSAASLQELYNST